jgi:hypothetical protein
VRALEFAAIAIAADFATSRTVVSLWRLTGDLKISTIVDVLYILTEQKMRNDINHAA